jgi:hypothetical protein
MNAQDGASSRVHDLVGTILGLFAALMLATIRWQVDTSGPDPFYKGSLIFPILVSILDAACVPACHVAAAPPSRRGFLAFGWRRASGEIGRRARIDDRLHRRAGVPWPRDFLLVVHACRLVGRRPEGVMETPVLAGRCYGDSLFHFHADARCLFPDAGTPRDSDGVMDVGKSRDRFSGRLFPWKCRSAPFRHLCGHRGGDTSRAGADGRHGRAASIHFRTPSGHRLVAVAGSFLRGVFRRRHSCGPAAHSGGPIVHCHQLRRLPAHSERRGSDSPVFCDPGLLCRRHHQPGDSGIPGPTSFPCCGKFRPSRVSGGSDVRRHSCGSRLPSDALARAGPPGLRLLDFHGGHRRRNSEPPLQLRHQCDAERAASGAGMPWLIRSRASAHSCRAPHSEDRKHEVKQEQFGFFQAPGGAPLLEDPDKIRGGRHFCGFASRTRLHPCVFHVLRGGQEVLQETRRIRHRYS